jgi:hypothetical protein
MKKILVVLLVLGLATASQAGLVISVNGDAQITEVTLKPSESITLGISTVTDTITGYVIDFKVATGDAELVTTGMTFPATFDFASGISGNPTLKQVSLSGSQFFGAPLAAPQTIMQGLVLHCLGEDPAGAVTTLQVLITGTTIVGTETLPLGVLKTIIIHQIPEPMTMMLLGLGSLFLVRRKK